MSIRCKNCLKPLEIAQYSLDGELKSCPKCSTDNGVEHIFYKFNDFGYTEHRVTLNNSKGIQSWCSVCRGRSTSIQTGTKCSSIFIK